MSDQNLIICEDKILYDIFLEIKEFLKFELKFFLKKDILKIKSENIDNYLILTNENITNFDHILKID